MKAFQSLKTLPTSALGLLECEHGTSTEPPLDSTILMLCMVTLEDWQSHSR